MLASVFLMVCVCVSVFLMICVCVCLCLCVHVCARVDVGVNGDGGGGVTLFWGGGQARNITIQPRELLMSLHILANLATYSTARRCMRSLGIVKSLKQVGVGVGLGVGVGAGACVYEFVRLRVSCVQDCKWCRDTYLFALYTQFYRR
jgi:hypothetical protein